MLFRNASILALGFAFASTLGAAGCRDNNTLTPADLSMSGGGGGGTGGGGDMATGSTTYTVATIAAMRGGAPGSYELDNVTVIAKTSSSASPHLVVQDAAGGDFSAIDPTCSATSTSHPCPANSTVKTIAVGEKVTITGLYIKASNANGATETFYVNSAMDNGPATGMPAVQTVALTDISRNAQTKKWWFMHVKVDPPPAASALQIYDLTPSELVFSGGTGCPKQVGWGMAPMSTAGAATALMCTGTTQPAGSTAPDAAEVLIGTEFYKDFNISSDCACAKPDMGTADQLVTATTATTGSISGILLYDSVFGSSPVKTYQYLSPVSNTDMPLSNTM